MFKNKIKPPLVLTLICVISCMLLVLAYEATYVDNTGIITDKMIAGLDEIYGTSDGFEIIKNADGTVKAYEGVTSVLKSENGLYAYEITVDGYNAGGLHVLIGFDDTNKIKGISILTINETPGLGTKVSDAAFLSQFTGLDGSNLHSINNTEAITETVKAKAVWGSKKEIDILKAKSEVESVAQGFELDAITGATYSSNGIYNAAMTALKAHNEKKEG